MGTVDFSSRSNAAIADSFVAYDLAADLIDQAVQTDCTEAGSASTTPTSSSFSPATTVRLNGNLIDQEVQTDTCHCFSDVELEALIDKTYSKAQADTAESMQTVFDTKLETAIANMKAEFLAAERDAA